MTIQNELNETESVRHPRVFSWQILALTVGPALVVMLADTEAGSVISAAQGGAQWGYRLVLPQLLMTPALFMAQELAGRLGLFTRMGLAELAWRRFGRIMAAMLLVTLVVSCAGALVTELSGIAGVGEMFGLPTWQTTAIAVVGLLTIVWTGSYSVVERVALVVGSCELAFVLLAWLAKPNLQEFASQAVQAPIGNHGYLFLLAATLGTCVIPWAVFYQQSASIDKGLNHENLVAMRIETLVGAIFCQVATAAIVIAAAAALGHGRDHPLDKVGDIAEAFTSAIGPVAGRVIFVAGLSGGALVAAVVVCLAGAWAFGEVLGARHSLSESPMKAPWFYAGFTVLLIAGGGLVASGTSLVNLAVTAGVLNAVLVPVVLGFLYYAARRDLPRHIRLQGAYAVVVAIVFTVTSVVGLYAGIVGSL